LEVIGKCSWIPIASNRFLAKITSFAISEVAYYSASVDNKVLLFPALDLYAIGAPLHKRITSGLYYKKQQSTRRKQQDFFQIPGVRNPGTTQTHKQTHTQTDRGCAIIGFDLEANCSNKNMLLQCLLLPQRSQLSITKNVV
jgi:hypothetical protein